MSRGNNSTSITVKCKLTQSGVIIILTWAKPVPSHAFPVLEMTPLNTDTEQPS